MDNIDDFIMKVQKFFHQDPESLRLKREEEHLKRRRELQEMRELIAKYEREMDEKSSGAAETRRKRERRKKTKNRKELGDQQKPER